MLAFAATERARLDGTTGGAQVGRGVDEGDECEDGGLVCLKNFQLTLGSSRNRQAGLAGLAGLAARCWPIRTSSGFGTVLNVFSGVFSTYYRDHLECPPLQAIPKSTLDQIN